MPFVRRNWKGEITGLFANPQADTPPEELPEDNPEVQRYRAHNPLPAEFLKPPSEDDLKRAREQHARLVRDFEAIRLQVGAFNHRFSQLELALGNLLSAVLNIPNSRLAHAIYYSPTSFDARAEIVTNAVMQICSEQNPLADLLPIWRDVAEKIGTSRKLRNFIAHSSPLTYTIGRKMHARLSAPAFDVIRVGRILAKRQVPGLTGNDIERGVTTASAVIGCVDHTNRLVTEFHEGNPSLQERYAALRLGLTKLGSP